MKDYLLKWKVYFNIEFSLLTFVLVHVMLFLMTVLSDLTQQ